MWWILQLIFTSFIVTYSSAQKCEAVIPSTTKFADVTVDNVAYDVPKVRLQEIDGDVEHQYETVGDYDKLSPINSSSRVGSKPPQKLFADCAAYETIENCHS